LPPVAFAGDRADFLPLAERGAGLEPDWQLQAGIE